MKEIESTPKKGGFDYSKLLNKVIIAVIAIAIFIVLLVTGQILFILQIFGWIENQVRIMAGLDMMLVKGITAVLIAIILFSRLADLFFPFFLFHKKTKN
jgi:cytochrome b subunit of formate dehydrogenase